MADLVIVGNGFDIAHKLKTKYIDFIEYICVLEKEPIYIADGWGLEDSMSKEDQAKNELYEKLKKYIPEEDLWYSLEESLGQLDYEQLKEDNSEYFIGYGDDNWKDSANHDYQFMINEELNFTDEMTRQFTNWIETINTMVQPLPHLEHIMTSSNIYLNFNYTDTLESSYGISESSIKYVHGKAKRKDKLILGHHDDSFWSREDLSMMTDEEYGKYMEYQSERDFREMEAEQIIEDYFKRTYKDTQKIISEHNDFFKTLSHVNDIYILGHSLSDIDFNYFKQVKANTSSNCRWIISCYSPSDYDRANNLIEKLGVVNFEFIKI